MILWFYDYHASGREWYHLHKSLHESIGTAFFSNVIWLAFWNKFILTFIIALIGGSMSPLFLKSGRFKRYSLIAVLSLLMSVKNILADKSASNRARPLILFAKAAFHMYNQLNICFSSWFISCEIYTHRCFHFLQSLNHAHSKSSVFHKQLAGIGEFATSLYNNPLLLFIHSTLGFFSTNLSFSCFSFTQILGIFQ